MDEEGTGLGPTLEFFALVAAEFQRSDLGMWICDDNLESVQARYSIVVTHWHAHQKIERSNRADTEPPNTLSIRLPTNR